MQKSTDSFQSKDNLKFHKVVWRPQGDIKAALVICHGHGEHVERYDWLAGKFGEHGFAVIGMDHRGHGKTEGPRGHTPTYDALMDDMEMLMAHAEKEFGDVPKVIYGHSMGGNIAANFILRRQPKIAAGILSAPWFRLPVKPPVIKDALGKMMNNIWPSLAQPTGLDANLISRVPEEVQKYKNDSLVHDKMSARLYVTMVEAGEWVMANANKAKAPLYLLHGSADGLTSHKATQEFASKLSIDNEMKIWLGFYHEMHNEKEKDAVLDQMIAWTNTKL